MLEDMRLRFMVPARMAFLEADRAGSAMGVIDSYRGVEFPLRCTFHLLLSFEAATEEAGVIVTPALEVRSPDGELLCQRSIVLKPGPLGEHGEAWVSYATLLMTFTARTPGAHEIECRLGGELLGSSAIAVLKGAAGTPVGETDARHSERR